MAASDLKKESQVSKEKVNRYTTDSTENLMSLNAIPYAHHASPTPLPIIHGRNDKYCLPKFAQETYKLA